MNTPRQGSSMKKGLVGCLLVGIVLIAVAAGLTWYFVLRPIVGAGNAVVEGARDWASTVDAEQAITNQAAFVAPPDGRLTQEQVNRFVAVQSNLQLRMGVQFDELKAKVEQMRADQAAGGGEPDFRDVAGAFSGLGALLAKAREAQVEGLNQQKMSLAEYRWIREQAYAALPFIDLDPDAIVAPKPPPGAAVDAATGEVIQIPDEPLEAVPADGDAAGTTGDDSAAAPEEDSGLEYAGTAPDEPPPLPADTTVPPPEPRPVAKPVPDELAETVKDRGLGDDRALDTPAQQAARANAVLLRPHKDLLLRTLGGSWTGL
jgi:hypothetical protein